MTKKQSATDPKPPSAPLESNVSAQPKTTDQQAAELNAVFLSLAVEMSWQLAAVVIIPIVGGYMLDHHYHRSPWLTIAGVIVAAVGVFGVMQHVLAEANKRSSKPKGTV